MSGRILSLLLLCLILLSPCALADEWLEKGDELARWGAYFDADKAYLKSKADRNEVLLRRLTIAENLINEHSVETIAAELLQSPDLSPEQRMRISLARATVAGRAYQFKEPRKHNQEAQRLVEGLDSPSATLARYAISSMATLNRWEVEGIPTPEEFRAEATKQRQVLASLDPYGDFYPLDYTRAGHWGRIWVFYAALLALEDQENAETWNKIAGDLIMTNFVAAWDRAQKAHDPEALSIALHSVLDLADNIYLPTQLTAPALKAVEDCLEAWAPVLEAKKKEIQTARFVERDRILGRILRTKARYALEGGNLSEAEELWEQAAALFAEIGQPFDQADTHYQAAFVLATAKPWHPVQSAKQIQAAIRLTQKVDYLLLEAMSWELLANLHRFQDRPLEAEKAFWRCLKARETMVLERGAGRQAQSRLLDRQTTATEGLIEVLLAQGKKVEAMEVLRRQRARELLSNIDLSSISARKPEVKQALRQVRRTRGETRVLKRAIALEESRKESRPEEVKRLREALKQSRSEFFQAINRIKSEEPEYERLVSIRPTNFSKLQAKLPPEALLVQYFAGKEKLYIFVAGMESLAVLEVPVEREALQNEVMRLSQSLRRLDKDLKSLETLHKHLIEPLEPYLKNHQTLVVAPSEFLYLVPFSALKNEQYLIERKTVVTLTSLEVFSLFGKGPKRTPPRLLAFADPDGSLPDARLEVRELATLFDSPNVYLSAEATKDRLAEIPDGTSVIHFATHGVLNPRDVNETYLAMAGSGADARLTVGEIYGLSLPNVQLVTLSACQTKLGERESVAEVASLAQAFSVAGSQTILASLWPVGDQGTRILMVSFYKHLMSGLSAGEALRAAKISMLKDPKYSHPYFWAAFELLGDWR